MQLDDRKSDRTQLKPLFNSKFDADFESEKTFKKLKKIAKTKKHDFCSVYSDRNFAPNQKKFFFFEFSTTNYPEKVVF